MLGHQPSRRTASVQAMVVVFVWATSWILVKRNLHAIPALSFAGLRYGLAFVCLLVLLVGRPAMRSSVAALWVPDIRVHIMRPARTHGSAHRGDLAARPSQAAARQLARRV